jgi:hypothetical protein
MIRADTPAPRGALPNDPPADCAGEPRAQMLRVASVHTLNTERAQVCDG